MGPAIQIDLVKTGTIIVGNHDEKRLALNHLKDGSKSQHGRRQTARLRAVLPIVIRTLLRHRRGRGKPFRFAGVDGRGRPPHPGEIGLATGGTRRRTGGRSVPLTGGRDGEAVFTERAQLGGVLQANVHPQCFGRLDGDCFSF